LLPAVTDKIETGTFGNRYLICGPAVAAEVWVRNIREFRRVTVLELMRLKISRVTWSRSLRI
jgi:hypothetical protein